MKLHPIFTTISPLSRGLFLALLVVLPLWGFYLGIEYMNTMKYEQEQESRAALIPSKPIDKVTAASMAVRNKLDECITDLKQKTETAKTKYEKGTLIASFATSTSYTAAQKVVAGYTLSAATSTESADSYKTSRTLTVTVPEGEEFRWTCILDEDSSIVYVGLNPIFELHE